MAHINLHRRGLMLVLSSPSGAGKTTLSRSLLASEPDLAMSVSATTRPMRPGEVEGRDYFFISEAEFIARRDRHEFLEHAKVFGNYYGTPANMVEQALNNSRDVLFDIDWQGTQQLKARAREDLVSVFILPPSRRLNFTNGLRAARRTVQKLWRPNGQGIGRNEPLAGI